ncbi:MAG: hypothetical protein A2Z18_10545 [Armatimonadetes bacterium RBG_16_58_9]|nr:MAG: hypothetical protein A2Z18_10545 [Armatimonadetes bacterium RBG_16_58_9]
MAELTYRDALNQALKEEMANDPSVFVLGEDIGLYGGAYKVTDGLLDLYGPDRVRDTPISESAIVGAAIGSALGGMRPVAELQYFDFVTIAMDQVANQAAKIRYMLNGQFKLPLVIRTQGGAGRALGAHHSQCLEAWFLHTPGIKVVMPGTPADAKGLLKSAIRDDDPVLFIEHKMIYGLKGEVPDHEYTTPIGNANVIREGTDVTIISYSLILQKCLQAADELSARGIEAEIIDLRTISPMDTETIVESVRKTQRAVVVEEDCKTGGVGAEIVARINEHVFYSLEAPVLRVAAKDTPVPTGKTLEDLYLPQVHDILRAVAQVHSLV